MAECLVQARYLPQVWGKGATPPDLLGTFEKLGAKFQGVWYSFGQGEYDFVAIVEVPASIDVAALAIAAKADWIGKPFDKITITPLLDRRGGAIAWERAAQALVTHEDTPATRPPPDSALAGRNPHPDQGGQADGTDTEPMCESEKRQRTADVAAGRPGDAGVDKPNGYHRDAPMVNVVAGLDQDTLARCEHLQTTAIGPAEIAGNGQSGDTLHHRVFEGRDGDGQVDKQSYPPAVVTLPAQTTQRRRRKTLARAAAVAVILTVLAVSGYFGFNAISSSNRLPSPPSAAAAAVPADLPGGAMACKKVYTDIRVPFDAGARGTPTTSCPFVEQVRRTYSQLSSISAPVDQIHAISPSTEKWYNLACIPTGSYVTCTGGAAAVIYLYNTSH